MAKKSLWFFLCLQTPPPLPTNLHPLWVFWIHCEGASLGGKSTAKGSREMEREGVRDSSALLMTRTVEHPVCAPCLAVCLCGSFPLWLSLMNFMVTPRPPPTAHCLACAIALLWLRLRMRVSFFLYVYHLSSQTIAAGLTCPIIITHTHAHTHIHTLPRPLCPNDKRIPDWQTSIRDSSTIQHWIGPRSRRG